MSEKEIRNFIKQWIKEHYGSYEAQHPCYNINKLAQDLYDAMNRKQLINNRFIKEEK